MRSRRLAAGVLVFVVGAYERVREQDLKQNAGVLARFAGQAATTVERILRP